VCAALSWGRGTNSFFVSYWVQNSQPIYEAILNVVNEFAASHCLVALCLEGSPTPLVDLLNNLSYVDGCAQSCFLRIALKT